MDEATMREAAKSCDSCLNWLPICGAICCRLFTLQKNTGWKDLKKGYIIHYSSVRIPALMKEYYKLHNARLERGILIFKLDDFQVVGKTLYVFNRCERLTEDLKCKTHPNKPYCCRDFTVETYGKGKYYDPPECLWRFKREEWTNKIQ